MKDSPADKAGITQGDVIIEFMGREIDRMNELPTMVAETKVGTKAKVTVIRKGKKQVLTVEIGKLDEEKLAQMEGGDSAVSDKLGMTVQELTPELAKSLNIEDQKGLIVSSVQPGSPAATSGIKRGTIILEVNQQQIGKLSELKKILDQIKPGDNLLLLVKEGEHTRYVVLKNK
jgi:serine protease Do